MDVRAGDGFDAGGGGEQGAGRERRDRQCAGYEAQRDLQTPEQAIQDVGALDQVAHQQEQWDRHQRIVVEHGEGVLRQQVEHAVVEKVRSRLVVGRRFLALHAAELTDSFECVWRIADASRSPTERISSMRRSDVRTGRYARRSD